MFQNQQEYTCHRANLYSKAADWGHSCFVRKYSIKGIEFFQVFKTFFVLRNNLGRQLVVNSNTLPQWTTNGIVLRMPLADVHCTMSMILNHY